MLSKKPSSIKELIDGVDGSHHRSLSDMINGCGQTEAEKEVIDYYIWKIAVPRIRIENILAKAEVDELFLKLSKDELDKNYSYDEDDESDEVI